MSQHAPRIARYILNEREPVLCDDLALWKTWMQSPERWVQDTLISDAHDNPVRICTVFLGVDTSFGLDPPVLFETMVLGGVCDRELYRYCTWEDAKYGHAAVVWRVKSIDVTAEDALRVQKARYLANRTVQMAHRKGSKMLLECSMSNVAR